MTVTVFGNLILICIDLYNIIFISIFTLVLIEKIYINHSGQFLTYISKHLKVCQKDIAACCIFNSLCLVIGVWKCGQTQYFMFYVLSTPCKV